MGASVVVTQRARLNAVTAIVSGWTAPYLNPITQDFDRAVRFRRAIEVWRVDVRDGIAV